MQDFLPFFALARLPLLLQRLDAGLASLEQCLPSAPAEPGMRVEREAWCERGFKQTKCHSRERERNRSATTDRPRERLAFFLFQASSRDVTRFPCFRSFSFHASLHESLTSTQTESHSPGKSGCLFPFAIAGAQSSGSLIVLLSLSLSLPPNHDSDPSSVGRQLFYLPSSPTLPLSSVTAVRLLYSITRATDYCRLTGLRRFASSTTPSYLFLYPGFSHLLPSCPLSSDFAFFAESLSHRTREREKRMKEALQPEQQHHQGG